jgi:hypothetical protein
MYFSRGPLIERLLDDWIAVIEENWLGWKHDQQALGSLLRRKRYYAKELKLLCLPPTYADKGETPGADTVIYQRQVSTKLKSHRSIEI